MTLNNLNRSEGNFNNRIHYRQVVSLFTRHCHKCHQGRLIGVTDFDGGVVAGPVNPNAGFQNAVAAATMSSAHQSGLKFGFFLQLFDFERT